VSRYLKIYFPFNFLFDSIVVVQECEFVDFPRLLLLLMHSFIPWWSGKTLDMISVYLNLSRLVPWSSIGSNLESVLCALERNVCSIAVGWNDLYVWWVHLVQTIVQVWCFLSDFLSRWSVQYWKWGVWSPHYYNCLYLISFHFIKTGSHGALAWSWHSLASASQVLDYRLA
jgi:hypothetical protein